jgi:hypothetical protein
MFICSRPNQRMKLTAGGGHIAWNKSTCLWQAAAYARAFARFRST